MKALLVTSRVTFVPDNYDRLIVGLAACEQVGGLLVLDNAGPALWRKTGDFVRAGARRLAAAVVRNRLGPSGRRRRAAFRAAGKPVWSFPTVNDPRVLALLARHRFDLILNARTRFIYERAVLEQPRLGAVNIHHGLLPEQRGTMCDLWALAGNEPAGFSLHRMTARVDAGDILAVAQVSDGAERDYLAYLRRATETELGVVRRFLRTTEAAGALAGRPNLRTSRTPHRRDPGPADVAAMKRKRILL